MLRRILLFVSFLSLILYPILLPLVANRKKIVYLVRVGAALPFSHYAPADCRRQVDFDDVVVPEMGGF